ncbi:tRNA (guanine(9)-N(1))-methyltransferase [Malassezia psittaci]|uniref:tRNA (guanine(9)-N1)-methyltransferase n=1 Tax=Malassezia psittaci TaxID=1821823 RepID=A0AAF0FHR2_9BASI|nr:tRNA (guanine(9)-N(1))-methyltransferase [Malassezia psittaci]
MDQCKEANVPEEQRRKLPPVTITDPRSGEKVQLSKTAAKKLLKRVQRQEHKDATKQERRAKERQRRKEKQIQLREERKKNPLPAAAKPAKTPAIAFKANLVVDLGFDDLMTTDEATSLAAQLGYLYGENRASSAPFQQLIFTGAGDTSGTSLGFAPPHGGAHQFPESSTKDSSLFQDRVGVQMETKNRGSWRRWTRVMLREYGGIEGLSRGPNPICDPSNMVYLTADSDHTIHELQEGKTYIIGGIVDRNRYKHLCAKKAEHLGIPTARLPIEPTYLGQALNARKVLTVNQVFAILVGWTETRDWKAALQRGLPSRKLQNNAQACSSDAILHNTLSDNQPESVQKDPAQQITEHTNPEEATTKPCD